MFKPRQTVTGLLNGVIGLVLGPKSLSPGCRLIVALAVTSTAAIALRSGRDAADLEFWVFARPHHDLYMAPIADWNAHEETSIDLHLLSLPALERRMMSGFLSDVPVADLIEADVRVASRAFTGPLEDVGFLDITDRIRDEGIADEINAPSFSPWTRQGRIFGLPHDVHPVLLCYRRDLVEAAGIDPRGIETWDDFARVLAPLMADHDGDGRPDRYLLNVWDTQIDTIEALVLQAGGRYFDDDGAVVIDSEVNARVIATIATWLDGPSRIAIDAQEFMPSGNRLKLEGQVVASLMPDWLAGVWKADMPALSGKLALMPLPAWTPGGRRTSVWGGTMLGIAKTTTKPEAAWRLAKRLYLSDDVAERLYLTNGIISPNRRLWSNAMYDAADPYFGGQAPGRLFIDQAADVPRRSSSPFNQRAKERVRDALTALRQSAGLNESASVSVDDLMPAARRELGKAAESMRRLAARNVLARPTR